MTTYKRPVADARGASKLVIDAVTGVTNIVEDMHRHIGGVAPIVGTVPAGRTRGLTGLVYRSVRGVTRAVGIGLDAALLRLMPFVEDQESSPRREAILAAVNGVLGDYLDDTGNPLAITMQLRCNGHPLTLTRAGLAAQLPDASDKILIFVHGLCMNDLQWTRDGHNHGAALARDVGYTAVHLHYNTGRNIAANGRAFAEQLEALFQSWPIPAQSVTIIGHSMGGLVARSACLDAEQRGHAWRRKLGAVVFLGTPHFGAPLERAGHGIDFLLEVSPYSAPFARLGKIRSAGIQDLRHGKFVEHETTLPKGAIQAVPMPEGVRCFAIAASIQVKSSVLGKSMRGDGLVPVESALGRHPDVKRTLAIPASHQAICFGLNHFDLLGSTAVYARLNRWLKPASTR